jgi:hypothetical protein
MITKLTVQQEKLIPVHRQEWLDKFFKRSTPIDKVAATEGINWLYQLAGLENPMIIFVDSPIACQQAANLLKSISSEQVWTQVLTQVMPQVRTQVRTQDLEYFHFSLSANVSDYSWVSFYDYFRKIGLISLDKFDSFLSLTQSGIYDMIQLKGLCIVSAFPIAIHRDENNRLHSVTGPAITFADGYGQYWIHGRNIPAWIITNPEQITKEKFITESNSEIRAAMYEVLGTEGVLHLLEAIEVDTQTILHPCNENETLTLYKTKEKFQELDNSPLAWVRFVCPSTGTNYLIDVEPHHTNVIDAAKSTRSDIFDFAEAYAWNFRA